MIRLFVAVELPQQVRDRLADLHYGLPGARWLDADALHLTLRFIGEVDQAQAIDIDAALLRVAAPAFAIDLVGAGHFASRGRARVLWVGVAMHRAGRGAATRRTAGPGRERDASCRPAS